MLYISTYLCDILKEGAVFFIAIVFNPTETVLILDFNKSQELLFLFLFIN